MSDGSVELQTAIYTTLNSLSPALASGGIFAPAPQNTPLPYVEVQDGSGIANDVVGRNGLQELVNVHVWTNPGSFVPAKQIISRIRDALHLKNLAVSGQSYASVVVSSTRVFNDEDGTSIHGVVSLTVNHFGAEES
ncbi:DUF3168 domain-containing protein [Bradyrhizobium sp. STM 3561]|uniref:DUF3168 domain-containing protein n=1 Tax=Bradyrhizobium sp. STM 3561 TaxID=578923 RepID=UPI003890E2FF